MFRILITFSHTFPLPLSNISVSEGVGTVSNEGTDWKGKGKRVISENWHYKMYVYIAKVLH